MTKLVKRYLAARDRNQIWASTHYSIIGIIVDCQTLVTAGFANQPTVCKRQC